jgi:hypothetical protein
MLRLAILTLILLALGFASAGGRAACRAEFGLEARLVCYAEEVLWGVGPLEIALGVEYRTPDLITPYAAIAYYHSTWWALLELGRGFSGAWRWAIGVGVRW